MKNMGNGYYKIGHSKCPQHRERTLQAEEPDVRLLAAIDGSRQIERKLQSEFKAKRLRGEWFRLNYGDISVLASLFNSDRESVDPPIEVLEDETWVAKIYRYAPDEFSTRVWTSPRKEWLFEVPYVISRREIDEEVSVQIFSCRAHSDICAFLERLPYVLLEHYSVDDTRVELRELLILGENEKNAFYVLPNAYELPRFFHCREYAEKFFLRVRHIMDILSKLDSSPPRT
jgi:hypothetical protein